MAESKKNNVASSEVTSKPTSVAVKSGEDLVEYMLPIVLDPNAPQQEFYSYNFRNFLIKRGVKVRIPRALREIIENQEKAKRDAILYANENMLSDPVMNPLKNRF